MAKTTTAPSTSFSGPNPPKPTAPTAPPADPARPVRVRRREHALDYLARQLTAPTEISTAGGFVRAGQPGDWVIAYDNGVAVDVIPEREYLARYTVLPPTTGAITLEGEHLTRVAKCLRFGATKNAADLTTAIEALASVQIGEIKIDFTQAQIAELKRRADKRSMSYEAYTKLIAGTILEQFFTGAL